MFYFRFVTLAAGIPLSFTPPHTLLLPPPPPQVLAVGDFNIAAAHADVHPAINYDTMYADEERALMAALLQVRRAGCVWCVAGDKWFLLRCSNMFLQQPATALCTALQT
jgi:hypothetical protein